MSRRKDKGNKRSSNDFFQDRASDEATEDLVNRVTLSALAGGVGLGLGVIGGDVTSAVVNHRDHPIPAVTYTPPDKSPEQAVADRIKADPSSVRWTPDETIEKQDAMLAEEEANRESARAAAEKPAKDAKQARTAVELKHGLIGGVAGGVTGLVTPSAIIGGLTFAERRRRKKEKASENKSPNLG